MRVPSETKITRQQMAISKKTDHANFFYRDKKKKKKTHPSLNENPT